MSNYGRKQSPKIKEIDEVEELLRATEDAMVLKLSINSHLSSSSSSSPLDQDLISRFEALKKPSVSKKTTKLPSKSSELKKDDGEIDPFARFSALKGGGGGSSIVESEVPVKGGGGGDASEEDEVEKLMQWAMDAARLDPSVSDEEEECVSSDDDDDDDDDDDTEDEREKEKMKKKKEKEKKKKSSKKSK